MKPHEDDLHVTTNGHSPALVAKSDGRMVAQLRQQDVGEWQALMIAAPYMARALIPVAERRCESLTTLKRECPRLWADPVEWCFVCAARAALQKAMVLQ